MSDAFKLSPQQKRLWLQPDQRAYRAQCAIAIDGPLDVERLKRAVQQIVERHEILRTTFQRQPGLRTPVQVIGDYVSPWHNDDQVAFDFEHGPLLRVTLSRRSESQHVLNVSLPALCADAATLKCLYDELCRTYDGQAISGESMQYADFAAWQNELLESEAAAAGHEFWQQRSIPQLTTGSHIFCAARALSDEYSVARFAFDHDPAPASTLQACWLALLSRVARQSEIVVGHVFNGRNYDELAAALGLMSRCVPVKVRLDDDPMFIDLLHDVSRDVQETEQWQEFWTWPSESRAQYFPVAFEYAKCGERYQAGDTQFSIRDQFVCFERHNLKLNVLDLDGTLHTELHYDPRAIAIDAVGCIADQFREIVASAQSNPQARLSQLRILSATEHQRLVVELNETARDYDRNTLVHQLFEQQAASAPEAIAVVCEDAQLTYADLNTRANQLARHLQKLGVGPETAVVLNVERSLDTLIGMLAIMKAGGAYLPLEGEQPRQRLAAIMDETDAPVVITQSSLKDQFLAETQIEDAQRNGKTRAVICIDTDSPAIAGESSANLNVELNPANVVYIIYTSGSTGKPKGVAVEHRQLSNYLHAINDRLGLAPNSGYAIVSTFAADLGNTVLFPALCTGGTLHVVTKQRATNAASLAEYFTKHPIDYLKIVPSHLEALLAHEQSRALLPRKTLVVGGEAAAPELINLVKELAPQCEIYNHYGPTETTVGILTNKLENIPSQSPALGRPLANNAVYVLDRRMQPVATGEIGEIYLGGGQVSRGYTGQAAATAERFVPNPFARNGERLYRTGDLGRYSPDGKIEFAGRVDSQIKLHGYRIELGEIRYALNQHPQISDSVAVVHRDENVLVAYYIAPAEIDDSELRAFLSSYLGSQAIPNFFQRLVRFPLNANGKIDLQALATKGKSTRPTIGKVSTPATPVEELLAGLWMKLLNVKQISTDDNFFNLGGHSLLATRIVSQLQKVLQIEVPFTVLFEAPTLGGTAKRLEALVKQQRGLQTPPLVRVSRDGELPLSFAQQRLWFLDQLQPNSSGYNNAGALRLRGPLNVAALEKTLNEIFRRHEILRTSFRATRGNPAQVIAPHVNIKLPLIDADELEALHLINEESRRPFDLASGPLWRMNLYRLGVEDHLLAVTMHHIVTDAWSNGVFMQEASALYKAFLHDQPSPLAELPVQYADFAAWQHQLLAGDPLEQHLAYWRRQLAGPLPMLELPGDRPRPEVRTFHGARQGITFSRELTDELRSFSQQRGVTLFMTLVAAFNVVLRYRTGQNDIVIGTDVANRNHSETEGLIGFFVNQLVLRTDLSGEPTFAELLEQVREVTLGAYTHQDLPFDRLVEALKLERNLKYAPFFEVKLVLENTAAATLELPGLTIESLDVETTEAKLDLILVLRERAEGLQGWFEYNRDLFNPVTVVRFGEQLEVLLRHVLASPGDRLSDLLQALTAFDRERREQEQQRSEKAWRQSFKTIKPQPISI